MAVGHVPRNHDAAADRESTRVVDNDLILVPVCVLGQLGAVPGGLLQHGARTGPAETHALAKLHRVAEGVCASAELQGSAPEAVQEVDPSLDRKVVITLRSNHPPWPSKSEGREGPGGRGSTSHTTRTSAPPTLGRCCSRRSVIPRGRDCVRLSVIVGCGRCSAALWTLREIRRPQPCRGPGTTASVRSLRVGSLAASACSRRPRFTDHCVLGRLRTSPRARTQPAWPSTDDARGGGRR